MSLQNFAMTSLSHLSKTKHFVFFFFFLFFFFFFFLMWRQWSCYCSILFENYCFLVSGVLWLDAANQSEEAGINVRWWWQEEPKRSSGRQKGEKEKEMHNTVKQMSYAVTKSTCFLSQSSYSDFMVACLRNILSPCWVYTRVHTPLQVWPFPQIDKKIVP